MIITLGDEKMGDKRKIHEELVDIKSKDFNKRKIEEVESEPEIVTVIKKPKAVAGFGSQVQAANARDTKVSARASLLSRVAPSVALVTPESDKSAPDNSKAKPVFKYVEITPFIGDIQLPVSVKRAQPKPKAIEATKRSTP
jgi:hypothetical protein